MERYERERLETVELDRDLVALTLLFFLERPVFFGVSSFDVFFESLGFCVVANINVEDFFGFEFELDSVDSSAGCFDSLSNDSGLGSSFKVVSASSGIGLKP